MYRRSFKSILYQARGYGCILLLIKCFFFFLICFLQWGFSPFCALNHNTVDVSNTKWHGMNRKYSLASITCRNAILQHVFKVGRGTFLQLYLFFYAWHIDELPFYLSSYIYYSTSFKSWNNTWKLKQFLLLQTGTTFIDNCFLIHNGALCSVYERPRVNVGWMWRLKCIITETTGADTKALSSQRYFPF